MAKEGKKEVATAAFEKMNKRQQLALLAAVGLKAGPNVSLVYAIDKFRRDKIREVLLYVLFLILFTVSALVQRDVTNSHYYTQTVRSPPPNPHSHSSCSFLKLCGNQSAPC